MQSSTAKIQPQQRTRQQRLKQQIFSWTCQLSNNKESKVRTYAFIDPGSSLTTLLLKRAVELRLQKETRQQLVLEGLNGTDTKTCYTTSTEIFNLDDDERYNLNRIYVVENINLPKLLEQPGDIARKYEHLRHVKILALDNLQVTVLIGQDNINFISPVTVEQGPPSVPSASLFKFGWTISRPHTVLDDSKTRHSMHLTGLFCSNFLDQDNDLNEEIYHWLEAETTLLEFKIKSNDPEVLLAKKVLNTTCVQQTDERYEMGPLWKDKSSLPDNRSQALTHLNHLVTSLQKKTERYKTQINTMKAFRQTWKKATLQKCLSIKRKIQDGTYHTIALSAQTNPTRYGESAMPKHRKAEQASMTNSKLDVTSSAICLEFCNDSDRELLPSRETTKQFFCKLEYHNKTDIICDSCGDNETAQN